VESSPVSVDYDTLVRQGPPENRHVRVTQCWSDWGYACRSTENSQAWHYVFVPFYSQQVRRADEGRSVRLIVRFSTIGSFEEFQEFKGKREFTGCIWDNEQIDPDLRQILHKYYPKIDFDLCRVIRVGDPLPSKQRARAFLLYGMAGFVVSVILASYCLSSMFGKSPNPEKARAKLDPFASDVPGQQLLPQEPPPSALTVLWWQCSKHALPVAVMCGVVIYTAMHLGFIPGEIGKLCLGVCVGVAVVFGGATLFSRSKFHEFAHEPLEPHELPNKARRYFDLHTPALERLGFQRIADVRCNWVMNSTSRRLLSADGRTMAFLTHISDVTAMAFQSVTSDGVKHETSDFDGSELMDASLPFRQQVTTGAPANLFDAHREWVASYESTHQVETLAIEPDQISTVVDYGNRVLAWSSYRKGLRNERPPLIPRFKSIEMLSNLLKRGMPAGAAGCR
jgi:hypothetical protein